MYMGEQDSHFEEIPLGLNKTYPQIIPLTGASLLPGGTLAAHKPLSQLLLDEAKRHKKLHKASMDMGLFCGCVLLALSSTLYSAAKSSVCSNSFYLGNSTFRSLR